MQPEWMFHWKSYRAKTKQKDTQKFASIVPGPQVFCEARTRLMCFPVPDPCTRVVYSAPFLVGWGRGWPLRIFHTTWLASGCRRLCRLDIWTFNTDRLSVFCLYCVMTLLLKIYKSIHSFLHSFTWTVTNAFAIDRKKLFTPKSDTFFKH